MAAIEVTVRNAAALREGKTLKFKYGSERPRREGFVVRYRGRLYAYRNECRHIPMTMDWMPNRFFSRDGCHLQCATHGALYEPDTGLCVWGPPEGQSLLALPIALRGNDAVITIVQSE